MLNFQNTDPISISDFNTVIKATLEEMPPLQNVWLSGEISSFKLYQNRQAYLTLSDGESQLNAVMYQNGLQTLRFTPEIGQQVTVFGKTRFYNKKGQLNFQVNFMSSQGSGQLSEAFKKLKDTLEKEGLFEVSLKKPLPKYPENIALITAPKSAAMWDFITLCRNTAPSINITVIPATVQGPLAIPSILDAFETAKQKNFDLIVLMRGGGSNEDLACFNSEELARLLPAYPLPVVTAIGHEINTTLADLTSSQQCATPSAAVEHITQHYQQFQATTKYRLKIHNERLKKQIANTKQTILYLIENGLQTLQWKHKEWAQRLNSILQRLDSGNPLKKLQQGYSITKRKIDGKILRSIHDANPDDLLSIAVSDGSVITKVIEKHEH